MVTGYFQPRSVSAARVSGKGAHLVIVIGADRSALARNTFGDPGSCLHLLSQSLSPVSLSLQLKKMYALMKYSIRSITHIYKIG